MVISVRRFLYSGSSVLHVRAGSSPASRTNKKDGLERVRLFCWCAPSRVLSASLKRLDFGATERASHRFYHLTAGANPAYGKVLLRKTLVRAIPRVSTTKVVLFLFFCEAWNLRKRMRSTKR